MKKIIKQIVKQLFCRHIWGEGFFTFSKKDEAPFMYVIRYTCCKCKKEKETPA
jgi:hypothetical protein